MFAKTIRLNSMKNFIMEILDCYHLKPLINLGIIKGKTTGLYNDVLQ